VSKITTEDIRRLARRVGCRKRRSYLTAAKQFTTTEKLIAGGAVIYLSIEKSGFGIMDNGVNKAFCSRVCLFVNS